MIYAEPTPDMKFLAYLKTLTPFQRMMAFDYVRQNTDFCWECGEDFSNPREKICWCDPPE